MNPGEYELMVDALQALLRLHSSDAQRGPHETYARLLGRVFVQLNDAEDVALSALARAVVDCWRGRFESALAHAETAGDVLTSERYLELKVTILATRGRLAGALYQPSDGMRLFEQAQTALKGPGHESLQAWLHQQLGLFLLMHDLPEAEKRIERALMLVRATGQALPHLQALTILAICRIARGAPDAGEATVCECEKLLESDDARSRGTISMLRAVLEHERGELESGQNYYESAMKHRRDLGSPWLLGLARLGLGELLLERGVFAASEVQLAQALEALQPLKEQVTVVWTLCGLGTL